MYVGRIVVVGKTSRPFAAYRVSSRSFPNRVARITNVGAAIQPLDPEDMKRNPYIAYNCLRVSQHGVVVSNGAHTDPIFDLLEKDLAPLDALRQVLAEMGYEKDDYNTPRIAGIVTEDKGYLGTVRIDGVEVAEFDLVDNLCRLICTYEMDHTRLKAYPCFAQSAAEAARFVVSGGIFQEMELPICAAAWMGVLAVYNPHEK